ncbi:Uncharacterised protein [Mycobacterium tuberculosis]|nr:Uncharacterised protein [Mycobacterium tuberculosis]
MAKPAAFMRSKASFTSSTSMERSGTGVPEPPSDAKLSCTAVSACEP